MFDLSLELVSIITNDGRNIVVRIWYDEDGLPILTYFVHCIRYRET